MKKDVPVLLLTGYLGSGKTTLVRDVFQDKKYISFDDKNMRELAAANPNDFIMAFPDGAIFDEAQKVPEIFDALKLHIDNTQWHAGKFILTGSSQFKLKKKHVRFNGRKSRFFNAFTLCRI